MVTELFSEDEEVVAEIENVYLTTDRVVKNVKSGMNTNYLDIQLDKVTSFDHSRDFNNQALLAGILGVFIGAFSFVGSPSSQFNMIGKLIGLIGLSMIGFAFLTQSKTYKIRSVNSDVVIELPTSENVFDFWKSVNQQKNH